MLDPRTILVPQLWDLRDRFRAKGFDLKLVGGCVRDLIAGVCPKDVDLHTDATPLECSLIYNEADVRFIETGISHGTITVMFDHVPYEITSLRRDVTTDGRHAVVAYTRDWLTDLERRDFTFNAMSMSFEGEVYDPFMGQQDLAQGVVRFVGDAATRIREDYLRILRWFRFRGRFEQHNSMIDTVAWRAVMDNLDGLDNISRERIWSEISKILVGPRCLDIMDSIHVMGVAQKLGFVPYHPHFPLLTHVRDHSRNPITMLVALYDQYAVFILDSMKSSNQDRELASWLSHNRFRSTSPSRHMAVDGVSGQWARELGVLRRMDAFELAVLETWVPPKFPVTGFDLMHMGIKPGPKYTQILQVLKSLWADSDYTLTKDQLLEQVTLV